MEFPETLLACFPKKRPDLPEAYRRIYVEHYRRNREGGSPATAISKRMESWMHRKVAEDVLRSGRDCRTLEIGAGNLNHLEYEPSVKHYDIVEPFADLYANSRHRSRLTNIYEDVAEISARRYDRIVSIATFEHLCDLPSVVARCGLLLEPRGDLRVAIPSEGTLLWTLGWKLTTGVEFRLRHRLDYGILMQHEHVNTADEIAGILQIFFKTVLRTVFGITASL